MIKIVIVEDNSTIRNGLKLLIDETEGYKCIGDYESCEDMLNNLHSLTPDVLLMDIGLPGISGIEGTRRVKETYPNLTILILTVYEDNHLIFDALKAGASGFLIKKTPSTRLLEAIKDAFNGGSPMSSNIARKVVEYFQSISTVNNHHTEILLTPREKELLQSLVKGKNYKAIGEKFFISTDTVRFHFRNIYKKLQVHSQAQAVAKAIQDKLV